MVEFRDRGPQLTRGARALKLWLSLQRLRPRRLQGRDRHGHRARRARRARPAASAAAGRSSRPPRSAIVCFRRAGADDEQTDAMVRAAVADGYAAPSTTILDGRTVARLCTINPRTTEHDIETHDRAARALRADSCGVREGRRTAGPPCSRSRSYSRRLVWSGPSGRSAGVALRGVREGCRPLGHAHRKLGHGPMRKVSRPASCADACKVHAKSDRRDPSWRVNARLREDVTALTGTLACDHAHHFANPIR